MKKYFVIGFIVLLIASTIVYAQVQRKINLPANSALITKISNNNAIAIAIRDGASITLTKANLALQVATPLIVQMVQNSIECDKVVKQVIKDENGVVLDTLYFHVIWKPYKEVTKVQISVSELDQRIADLTAQKQAIIAEQNKAIAAVQGTKDAIPNATTDEGE